jgi:hypothetical protein
VPLVEGALLNAPAESVVEFVQSFCKALHGHTLPDPSSRTRGQVGWRSHLTTVRSLIFCATTDAR